jgi:MFS transporter, SHS family, sialic acid transporter
VNNPPPRGRWLALAAALLGWMFDGFEMGLFPVVARDALSDLFGPDGAHRVGPWFGVITAGFLVGAAAGGVLFGWLGDKLGRVRAMTFSVLLYAGCSGLCGLAQEPWHLALLRFLGALGMGGEWALGVALVMELWPTAGRATLAGLIGAFGNLGYFVVGCTVLALNRCGDLAPFFETILPADTAKSLTAHNNWRVLMLLGAAPAVLTLFLRFFVPESEKWHETRREGKASHWSGKDLIAVLAGSAIGGLLIAVWAADRSYAERAAATAFAIPIIALCFLWPARGYLHRAGLPAVQRVAVVRRMLLAAGLSAVPLIATWAGVMWMYNWVGSFTADRDAKPILQVASSLGAAGGCVFAAWLGNFFGRRRAYLGLCIASAITLFAFYNQPAEFSSVLVASAFGVGFVTAGFYGWLPLYLPELFPTALRATGQGFGFNFGRVLAAVASLQTGALLGVFGGDYAKACSVTAGVYVFGIVLIAFAPETRGRPLPE